VNETACPHCGEPVEPRQLVCLNCGGRVALRERTPLAREPMTVVATVLVVVIVIGAGLFGFAISELTGGDGDGGGGGSERASATEPRVSATAPNARAEEPEAPAVVAGAEQEPAQAEEQQPAQPAAPPREHGVPGWPKGLTAYTVVLVTSSERAATLDVAREARKTGLEAGLLPSDPYNLGTGLWIVYSGHFTTREGAARQAGELARRYPGAYPQLIQSSQ
jgi:DNA-directed RNA polymerase subunit RPC12/RpoP